MTFTKKLLLLSICTANIAFGADQKAGAADWTRSTFYNYVKNHKIQEGDKTFVDRRAVAFDAIKNDLKPKGVGAWFKSWWSKPLYDLPIMEVASTGFDTVAQEKAEEMADQGNYYVPQRDKKPIGDRPFYYSNDISEKRDENTKKFGIKKALEMEIEMLQTEPDPFLKLETVRKTTVGELFEDQKKQPVAMKAKNNVAINDAQLDRKLGKTKKDEEIKLLDNALQIIRRSNDLVYRERRKLAKQHLNTVAAEMKCKPRAEGKGDDSCKLQEQYGNELVKRLHKLDAVQEELRRKNQETEEQLARKREELEKGREYNKWWKFWTKHETTGK